MTQRLLEAVKRYTAKQSGQSPFITPIEGLVILRSFHERPPSHLIFKPSLCITVQGAKRSTFGSRRFVYRSGEALVVSVDMPAVSRVIEASLKEPYLGIVLELDLAMMRDVLNGLTAPPVPAQRREFGVFIANFEGPLSDCVLRMVRLLDTPHAIPTIAPLIMREICYWLLTGPQSADIVQFVLTSSRTRRVLDAIYALRDRYAKRIRVEELAEVAGMSSSAFHREFKALTSMTPLQYQKQLRLLEARRLMATGAANAESAAYYVGYESPSQFSREYTRMFGSPPRRDTAVLGSGGA
jgi:AraC-like DNA-binding protein